MSTFMVRVTRANPRKRTPDEPDETVGVFDGPKAKARADRYARYLAASDVGAVAHVYDISDAKKVVSYQNTTNIVG